MTVDDRSNIRIITNQFTFKTSIENVVCLKTNKVEYTYKHLEGLGLLKLNVITHTRPTPNPSIYFCDLKELYQFLYGPFETGFNTKVNFLKEVYKKYNEEFIYDSLASAFILAIIAKNCYYIENNLPTNLFDYQKRVVRNLIVKK